MKAQLDADEDFIRILSTFTDQQMDKLIMDLQKTDKMTVLEYLLRKGNQWTEISSQLISNSDEETKDRQIRRLMNKQKNSFSAEDESDKMILDLLKKHQAECLDNLLTDMNSSQKAEILMQMLEQKQRGQLIELLDPRDVREFWGILSKERRMNCWDNFDDTLKFKTLIEDVYLNLDQKHRLWDNIGKDRRLAMWKLSKSPEIGEALMSNVSRSYRAAQLQKDLLTQFTVV